MPIDSGNGGVFNNLSGDDVVIPEKTGNSGNGVYSVVDLNGRRRL